MRYTEFYEAVQNTAVVGWGRGMGHKGHMYLASSVITQAEEQGADPYFVVSRTVGKDDPIKPEEKMQIYKKVFPKHGHIFHTATDEMPDLTRVLSQLDRHGYTDVTVVVGADQVKGLSYVKQYNGVPDKAGKIPFSFNKTVSFSLGKNVRVPETIALISGGACFSTILPPGIENTTSPIGDINILDIA